MTDLFGNRDEIVPSRKVSGRVIGLFEALDRDFVTSPTNSLELTFDGIVGDFHAGQTRRSGGRRALVSAWHRDAQRTPPFHSKCRRA